MLCRHSVKVIIFFVGAAPHLFFVNLRLVPYLPITDIIVIAIRPAFRIMSDDMLTYSCPLFGVFWRKGIIRLDIRLIFNSDTKAIIGLHTGFYYRLDQMIGKCKVIVVGTVFVGIKITKIFGISTNRPPPNAPPTS